MEQPIPAFEILPIPREELNAVVLPIGDKHPVAPIDPDRVRRHEFAFASAGRAPAREMPPVGAEAMHGRVAITVADIDLAVVRHRGIGRVVEGEAPSRPMALSEPGDLVSLAVAEMHLVRVAIDKKDAVVSGDENAMSIGDPASAVVVDDMAVRIEDQDRRIAPPKEVDIAAGIDGNLTRGERSEPFRNGAPSARHHIAPRSKRNRKAFVHRHLRASSAIEQAMCQTYGGTRSAVLAPGR